MSDILSPELITVAKRTAAEYGYELQKADLAHARAWLKPVLSMAPARLHARCVSEFMRARAQEIGRERSARAVVLRERSNEECLNDFTAAVLSL